MKYYFSFKQYLTNLYSEKVWRIPLSTGFPCPNRIDGKRGCSFCDGKSFIADYMKKNSSIEEQLQLGIDFFGKKYRANYFYGYFQENSSTFGDETTLLKMYSTVLNDSRIKGLIISTRPDCISENFIRQIVTLNKNTNKDLWIELGLQSIYDNTLIRINRNHTYDDFKNAVRIINESSNIKICVHLILGLPGEKPDMIIDGISRLFEENSITGIKIRMLNIIDGTDLKDDYLNNKNDFYHFNFNDYIKIICDIFERIPEKTVIMRTIDYNPINTPFTDEHIPTKDEILDRVRNEFERRGTKQGALSKRNNENQEFSSS